MEPIVDLKTVDDQQFLISPNKLNERAKFALQFLDSLKETTIESISKLRPEFSPERYYRTTLNKLISISKLALANISELLKTLFEDVPESSSELIFGLYLVARTYFLFFFE
jgi:hypothetical protein